MEYMIIIFLALAIFHLIYESIIAPSIRAKLSFELFAARDEARLLKIQHADKLECKHFEYLQSSINILLKSLHNFDVITLIMAMNAIKHDKDLQEHIKKRLAIFEDCTMPDAIAIRKKTLAIASKIIVVNNGAWLIYLIPIFIGIAFYNATLESIKEVFSLSEKDFHKVAPDRLLIEPV